jgi:hypothetical protein
VGFLAIFVGQALACVANSHPDILQRLDDVIASFDGFALEDPNRQPIMTNIRFGADQEMSFQRTRLPPDESAPP